MVRRLCLMQHQIPLMLKMNVPSRSTDALFTPSSRIIGGGLGTGYSSVMLNASGGCQLVMFTLQPCVGRRQCVVWQGGSACMGGWQCFVWGTVRQVICMGGWQRFVWEGGSALYGTPGESEE